MNQRIYGEDAEQPDIAASLLSLAIMQLLKGDVDEPEC